MTVTSARVSAFLGCLLVSGSVFAAKVATTITATGTFGTLPAVAFEGEEGMSRLFHFDVSVATDAAHPIAFDSTLGTDVSVTIVRGATTRRVSGICSRISESATADGFTYRLELEPRLALLALNQNSRIFQDKTVPDIVRQVLSTRGIDFEVDLTGNYPPRNFVVQYRESDFNFISRLMEEEGIYYYFTHDASGHHMVIGDSSGANPLIAGSAVFGDGVLTWQKSQQLTPGKVTLRDFTFQLPDSPLDAAREIQPTVQAGAVVHRLALPATSGLEVYDFPGGYAKRFDGVDAGGNIFGEANRVAAIRMQEIAAAALTIDGSGNQPQFNAGIRFTLAQHPNGDGQYLLTTVRHSTTGSGSKLDYQNTFICLPVGLPFRPPRATRLPVIGTQTAFVVGPAGEEIFADRFARVKVQFHWDREGKNDENSSMWIRVSALHQGEENGFELVPRIGDEVVVAFEEGDPDQPIIIGSVYNARRVPPPPPQ